MKHTNRSISDKYFHLRELGARFNLSFSSHLVTGNTIIALDSLKKRVMVVQIDNEESYSRIIELDQVKSISIKKNYSSIKAGELYSKGLKQFLQSIYLQFEHSSEDKTIILPFYERETDKLHDLAKLERNARIWQMILSKIITGQNNILVKEKVQLPPAGHADQAKLFQRG